MTGLLALPRTRLGTLPTPLHPAPRLSQALGVEIWLKRDDLTGLGLGGNKVRALEYLLADAQAHGRDCLVTGGSPQSNWAMLAALAARTRGIDTILISYGDPVPATGNLRLAHQTGAQVHFTGDPDPDSVDRAIEQAAAELHAAGRRPYPLPRGGATPLGALGYVRATLELAHQLLDHDLHPAQLWLATGSCGTQAGLVAGTAAFRLGCDIIGVTVSRPVPECLDRVTALAAGACALIGAQPPQGRPRVLGGHIGPGYGLRSPQGDQAADLAARTEGVCLDPVFAAKAMAALHATAATGHVPGPVIFLVSGGAPTLFSV